jgi:DUF4097 and DUF4098 domain-containing protein YvlB
MNHHLPLLLAAISPLAACVSYSRSVYTTRSVSMNHKSEREVTLPLAIAAGQSLRVATKFGAIRAKARPACPTPQVRVHLEIHARTKAEAEMALAQFEPRATATANGLELKIHGDPIVVIDDSMRIELQPMVDFEIEVPDGVRLEALTQSGEVVAEGALAGVTLESNFGRVAATGIRGPVMMTASSGALQLDDCTGDIEGRSTYGNVTASKVRSSTVDLSTSSGNIELEDASATTTKLHTKYGTVTVRNATGALDLDSGSGDIRVQKANGSLRAVTRYGSIDAQGLWRSLDLRSSSGSVAARADAGSVMATAWTLESTYGSVRLDAPAAFACNLEAATKYGDAKCEFGLLLPEGSTPQTGQLTGVVGNGGQLVRLLSGSGDVTLAKLATQ